MTLLSNIRIFKLRGTKNRYCKKRVHNHRQSLSLSILSFCTPARVEPSACVSPQKNSDTRVGDDDQTAPLNHEMIMFNSTT